MTRSKGNKPLDRDYFRYKDRPKPTDEKEITDCCGQETERDILNVNNKEDWELIEGHIERNLREYPSEESITPVSCKKCGRLQEYIVILKRDRKLPGD